MPLLLQLAATDIISGQGKEACAARLENGGFEAHDDDAFQSFFFGICEKRFHSKNTWRIFFIMIKALLSRDGARVDDARVRVLAS
jgi:hypothetical protein